MEVQRTCFELGSDRRVLREVVDAQIIEERFLRMIVIGVAAKGDSAGKCAFVVPTPGAGTSGYPPGVVASIGQARSSAIEP